MTSGPEFPPDLDVVTRPLTVAQLGNRITEYAYLDDKFKERIRPKTGTVEYWQNDNGFMWSADLEVEHVTDERRYLGPAATLTLTVAKEVPIISHEAHQVLRQAEITVPTHYFVGSTVHYFAQFMVSQYDTLGVSMSRSHVLRFKPDILASGIEGINQTPDGFAELAFQYEIEDIPVIDVPEPDNDDPEALMFERLELDAYTREAARIFLMVQTRDEGDFDLGAAFPRDVLLASHITLEGE